MEINNLLMLGIGLIVVFLIIRFVAKLIFKIIGLFIIVTLVAGYMYFYTDYFETHTDNKIVNTITDKFEIKSLKDYEKQFCKNGKSEIDKIKCKCIIKPILDDLKTKYSKKELKELFKNKAAYIKELIGAITRNKKKIKKLLDENNASHLWDETSENLQKGKFL